MWLKNILQTKIKDENSKSNLIFKMSEENPFANLDEETQRQIQELQMLEQNFQQLMMQKQAFQMEAMETDHALEELEKAEGDVFKIVGGQIIIKKSKQELEKELKHKKDLIDLRMKNITTQEEEFSEKINDVRDEIMQKISGKPEKDSSNK